jgi:hypothetical protein
VSDETHERLERMRNKLRKPTPEEAAAREVRSAAAQPQLLSLVERIARREGDPYQLAHDLYREAMTAIGPGGPNGEKAYVLYSVWTEFDDLGSYLGVRTPEVEQEMQSAAEEWLTLDQAESDAWRSYYDRWLARIKVLIEARRSA